MNRRLRSRHRWMTTVLAIVAAVVFVAGIASRPALPVMDSLPIVTGDAASGFSIQIAEEQNVRIQNADMRVALYRSAAEPERYAVELQPAEGQAVRAADVLVYWGEGSVAAGVSRGSYLIGTLAGAEKRRFVLPPEAGPGNGRLQFFSLAEQRLFDESWSLPPVAGGTP